MGLVEVVPGVDVELGESPVWDDDADRLLFVDIMVGAVHEFDPRSGADRVFHLGRPVGVVMPAACDGDRVVGAQGGFFRLHRETGALQLIAAVDGDDPDLRMNDGKCDSRGRFWAGSLSMSRRPRAAALYRLEPNGDVVRVLTGVTTSNGIDWSPDDTTMYYVDTGTGTIEMFDFDSESGAIKNRRLFAAIAPDDGRPDGLTVDAEGGVWVALWSGGAVRRYQSDGRLDRVISLPARRPTSCAFGGLDRGDLYITTARVGLTPAERLAEPHAGSLFRCRPGVTGRPPRRFGRQEP